MGMLGEYWRACGIEVDVEVLEIDKMEDAVSPLNEQTTQISALISAFSSCYHEADKEGEQGKYREAFMACVKTPSGLEAFEENIGPYQLIEQQWYQHLLQIIDNL